MGRKRQRTIGRGWPVSPSTAFVFLLVLVGSHAMEGCSGMNQTDDVLGMKIAAVPSAKPCGTLLMVSPGSMLQEYEFVRGEIRFRAGVDQAGIVVYLATSDPAFQTPEGIRVGTLLEKVLPLATGAMKKESGWAYYVTLPSGWNTAFTQGETMTEGTLPATSSVRWLFRRKYVIRD